MEDFTLTELKNIARDEGLSGWSKFKKDTLFDFLVVNGVNVTKYKKSKKCMKKSKESVVMQALDKNVEVVDQNLTVKTKTELCKNLSKKKKRILLNKHQDLTLTLIDLMVSPKQSKNYVKTSGEKNGFNLSKTIQINPGVLDCYH